MKRAEILSEAGILKEKVRLVSLLFIFHSLYWWVKRYQTYISRLCQDLSIYPQELKLQGIKIRYGIVLSRYSRDQCFAIKLSDFDNVL